MHKGKHMGMRSASTHAKSPLCKKGSYGGGNESRGVSGPCLVRNWQKKAMLWYHLHLNYRLKVEVKPQKLSGGLCVIPASCEILTGQMKDVKWKP